MKKYKLLACSLCFLGSTALQAAEGTGYPVRTVSHLFMVDIKERMIGFMENDHGMVLPSHEVQPNELSCFSIANHTNRALGIPQSTISGNDLHQLCRIECASKKPSGFLGAVNNFLSLLGLRGEEEKPLDSMRASKVEHFYYLWSADSKAAVFQGAPLQWKSIPKLYESYGKPGITAVEPSETLELMKLMTKFRQAEPLSTTTDTPSIKRHFEDQNLRAEVTLTVPAAFIEEFYKSSPLAKDAYSKTKKDVDAFDAIFLVPTGLVLGGMYLKQQGCTIQ